MLTSSKKAKGKLLTNHVCKRIREVFSLPESDVKSPPGSVGGEDIWLSETARKAFPFSIEGKNVKTLSLVAALEQAISNSPGYTSCVCHKPHGKGLNKTIISFYLDDFLKLWKEVTNIEQEDKNK